MAVNLAGVGQQGVAAAVIRQQWMQMVAAGSLWTMCMAMTCAGTGAEAGAAIGQQRVQLTAAGHAAAVSVAVTAWLQGQRETCTACSPGHSGSHKPQSGQEPSAEGQGARAGSHLCGAACGC